MLLVCWLYAIEIFIVITSKVAISFTSAQHTKNLTMGYVVLQHSNLTKCYLFWHDCYSTVNRQELTQLNLQTICLWLFGWLQGYKRGAKSEQDNASEYFIVHNNDLRYIYTHVPILLSSSNYNRPTFELLICEIVCEQFVVTRDGTDKTCNRILFGVLNLRACKFKSLVFGNPTALMSSMTVKMIHRYNVRSIFICIYSKELKLNVLILCAEMRVYLGGRDSLYLDSFFFL